MPSNSGGAAEATAVEFSLDSLLEFEGNPMDYYQYAGSLTTPPCTGGVRWVVLSTPATVSAAQLARFPYSNNFRPPQPLHERFVRFLSEVPTTYRPHES